MQLYPKTDHSTVDLSTLTKGIYFMKITTISSIDVRKIVLEY